MEDLDTPRVVPGKADEILRALELYGLFWDGPVAYQSRRTALYERALSTLISTGAAYPCGCSRADIARAASAPAPGDHGETKGLIYPGTCRSGLVRGQSERAIRFRVPELSVAFTDIVHGSIEEQTWKEAGDFVIKRSDGPFAYQLAVVVDDADQQVSEVVRGADLLSSTGRQICLQRALGLPLPRYAHLPLVLGADGKKLGKRDGSLPLATLDETHVARSLRLSLAILRQEPLESRDPAEILAHALQTFRTEAIPRGPVTVSEQQLHGQAEALTRPAATFSRLREKVARSAG
jgi:glutamyl-Q tRNA(Asp) synthetase